eukprot:TRINITY_DN3419_c0_g2_i2.p1 TRINITY_DN3419_c0_g2~~TRINITY_DN3419_c0_g2_i2.p1  ORF type:complete len:596 (-),score=97.64 TRINITY_DN3419_c0_g2_i2:489-2135(-)
MEGPYHQGEVAVQQRAGSYEAAMDTGEIISDYVPPSVQAFFHSRYEVYCASVGKDGRVWASALYGMPGFVKIADSVRTIRVSTMTAAGDATEQNISTVGAPFAVMGIEFASRSRFRLNGHISKPLSKQGFEFVVKEAFPNCPKYIQRRKVKRLAPPDDGTLPGPATPEQPSLSASHIQQLQTADTFFIATYCAQTGVDISHRGGVPGFVRVLNENEIMWPDYVGNGMFQTLGNLSLNPTAGIVVPNFTTGDLLQLTGTAEIHWDRLDNAERFVKFRVNGVVMLPRASPWRWTFGDYSPFNYPVTTPTTTTIRTTTIASVANEAQGSQQAIAAMGACATRASSVSATSAEGGAATTATTATEATTAAPGIRDVQLTEIRQRTHDVKTFTFTVPAGVPPVLNIPGQFATFHLNVAGKQLIRTWTISSVPRSAQDREFSITVKRTNSGVVSRWLHDSPEVALGATFKLAHVAGDFSCFSRSSGSDSDVPAHKILFIAAGIGVTPLYAMLSGIVQRREVIRSDVVFLYGVRSQDDIVARLSSFLWQHLCEGS